MQKTAISRGDGKATVMVVLVESASEENPNSRASTSCKALRLVLLFIWPCFTHAFAVIPRACHQQTSTSLFLSNFSDEDDVDLGPSLFIDPKLTQSRTRELFAWVACAMNGDPRFENLVEEALPAIFGQGHVEAYLQYLKDQARRGVFGGNQADKRQIGSPFSQKEREMNSLGPLGAGQWTGQFPEIFAHSVLETNNKNYTNVNDWTRSLPRTCRQTIRKAKEKLQQYNWTYSLHRIESELPAPQSTFEYFKCVLEHQIRVAASSSLSSSSSSAAVQSKGEESGCLYSMVFLDSVMAGIERFVLSLEMAGSILEYRNDKDQVVAFCHIIFKGKTVRGQWFYASDEASRMLLWFHSLWYMVQLALSKECKDKVVAVDLGPNGVDGQFMAHARLKQKYGFHLYDDWPSMADYHGSFRDINCTADTIN